MQQIYEILPRVHFLYILPSREGSLPCQLLLLQVRVQLFSTRGSSITWIYHMDICSYQKSRNNFQIFTSIFFSPKNTKLHIFPFMPYSRRVNGLGSEINQDFFFFHWGSAVHLLCENDKVIWPLWASVLSLLAWR